MVFVKAAQAKTDLLIKYWKRDTKISARNYSGDGKLNS